VIEIPRNCGANDMMRIRKAAPGLGGGGTSSPQTSAAAGACIAELACDADYEYLQDWGSVSGVESRINAVINAVNTQYERDVNITHVITTIIVRTSEPDPYTSSDAVTLLNQFRSHWEANHGNVQRDMAQLFTGKSINGGTIGIAWVGAVCSNYGYSMVESDFNGANSFACTTDLSAHELGHNWGAGHCGCQRPRPYTMNSFILCANQFHPRRTIPEIIAFRDSLSCLDSCGGVDPPPPTGCDGTTAVGSHTCAPGAKRNDCLVIDIAITCDGAPLSGVTVEVELVGHEQGDVLTGSATTDGNGEVSFKLRCKQAASNTYTSTVTSIDGTQTNVNDTNVQVTTCQTR
ncbi:MAG: M12 family metallo-peptidase, partial [Planctomycetota bacterium]|nr:M12 family metallo-peptidase [Planctomycetota bacterium]